MPFKNVWLIKCPHCGSGNVELDRRNTEPVVNGFPQICLSCGKRFIFTIDGVGVTPTSEVKKVSENRQVTDGLDAPLDQLRERVARGNDKLMDVWSQIIELSEPEHSAEIDSWVKADAKLEKLCDVLKLRGYIDCLYIVEGRKTRLCSVENKICLVCPSKRAYWVQEMLDRLSSPRMRKKGEDTMQFLKTLGGKI